MWSQKGDPEMGKSFEPGTASGADPADRQPGQPDGQYGVPLVDARLEDGSRVHVVLEPVALNGPILTIRKFPDPITMDRLLEYGSVTREAADLLKILAAADTIFLSAEARGRERRPF